LDASALNHASIVCGVVSPRVTVRDDKPFGGTDPPAAVFFYSRDRTAEHPERHLARFAGVLQADAYAGFNRLYAPGRSPGPIMEAACWSHGRRKFFVLADSATNARNKALGKQREHARSWGVFRFSRGKIAFLGRANRCKSWFGG
jgi:hypothetical protein